MGLSPDSLKAWLEKNAEVRKNARKGELPESKDFAFEEDDLACYNKNTGRRVKACVPMHSFGHPVRIDEMRQRVLVLHSKDSIQVHSVRLVQLASMATKPSLLVVAV